MCFPAMKDSTENIAVLSPLHPDGKFDNYIKISMTLIISVCIGSEKNSYP